MEGVEFRPLSGEVLPAGEGAVSREITVPRVRRDLFMNAPSFRLKSSMDAFSLPARSIILCCQPYR